MLHTASFNIQKSYDLPHSMLMCFVWISDQAAIVSLYSVKGLVSLKETACVYYAVRAGNLNTIQVNFPL